MLLKKSIITYPITSLSSLMFSGHKDELFSTSCLVATSLLLQRCFWSTGGIMPEFISYSTVGALHSAAVLVSRSPRAHTAQHGGHSSDNSGAFFKWCERQEGGSFQESPLQNDFHLVPISIRLWPKNPVPSSWKALSTLISWLILICQYLPQMVPLFLRPSLYPAPTASCTYHYHSCNKCLLNTD